MARRQCSSRLTLDCHGLSALGRRLGTNHWSQQCCRKRLGVLQVFVYFSSTTQMAGAFPSCSGQVYSESRIMELI